MTPERLAEIRVLVDAATPGPWVAGKGSPLQYDIVRQLNWTACGEPRHDDCMVCQAMHQITDPHAPEVAMPNFAHAAIRAGRDAAFIADARTAVPELLEEIERLTAQIQQDQAVIETLSNELAEERERSARYEAMARGE